MNPRATPLTARRHGPLTGRAQVPGDKSISIRALILANDFLEAELAELMKAVSHAYTRGRFHAYSG